MTALGIGWYPMRLVCIWPHLVAYVSRFKDVAHKKVIHRDAIDDIRTSSAAFDFESKPLVKAHGAGVGRHHEQIKARQSHAWSPSNGFGHHGRRNPLSPRATQDSQYKGCGMANPRNGRADDTEHADKPIIHLGDQAAAGGDLGHAFDLRRRLDGCLRVLAWAVQHKFRLAEQLPSKRHELLRVLR